MSGQTSLVRASAAAPTLSEKAFETMKRQAVVLSKTELVPKALQGKPEAIMLVGIWGAEHGIPLATAVQEVHIIENRPSPSAQLRLALIRRYGHEIRFIDTDTTKAVLRARRRENHDDPDAWVTVTYSLDDARKAELLDEWVERWQKAPGAKYDKKFTYKIGDDRGRVDLTDAPDWVHEEIQAGRVHSKDNWRKYPSDMLRARAAGVMSRMEFSDVMLALGIDLYTPEELGIDVGQDLDEPAASEGGPADEHDDGGGEVIDEAVVVEDLAPEPEETPPSPPPAPGETPPTSSAEPQPAGPPQEHPVPRPGPGERQDQADLRYRLWAHVPNEDKADVRAWLERCGLDPDDNNISEGKVAAVNAELDRRGYPTIDRPTGSA
jgi:hypothetical protein